MMWTQTSGSKGPYLNSACPAQAWIVVRHPSPFKERDGPARPSPYAPFHLPSLSLLSFPCQGTLQILYSLGNTMSTLLAMIAQYRGSQTCLHISITKEVVKSTLLGPRTSNLRWSQEAGLDSSSTSLVISDVSHI